MIGSPGKHTESGADGPANELQKSDFDCQKSVNLVEFEVIGKPAWPWRDGAKREFMIDELTHEFHTVEQ